MNARLSSIFRQSIFKRASSICQNGLSRRFYASDKDDSSDSSPGNKESADDTSKQQKLLDVTEYYSQYIKEYEQGGFKDEESVQWALRKEKPNISFSRGETGVIDLDEVVEFLRAERVRDVCTIEMPKSTVYASYMVIGTPMSRRHMVAIAEKLRSAYKRKRADYDPPTIRMNDKENPEWRVFDLGHIVIHIMMRAQRQRYDIEMLWAVGEEHDDLTNAIGELDEYSDRLKKLQEEVEMLSSQAPDSKMKKI